MLLSCILLLTSLLLCYAGYIFLIVDRRQETKELEDPELFAELDDKNYDFELPLEVDSYDELKLTEPADKRALPMALLDRAKADIPRIEQLEKDHPRMARLFQKGLLPFGIWEQLTDAEAAMDAEVHTVQAEAERLQKGWGQGVFSQAYQMLRADRDIEARHQQKLEADRRDVCALSLEFTKLSGGVVLLKADGRKVASQTPMKLREESATEEVAFKSDVKAEMVCGSGGEARTYCAHVLTLELDGAKDKQWKQIGSDPTGLRLQVKFVRKVTGAHAGFVVGDIRATVPQSAADAAVGSAHD